MYAMNGQVPFDYGFPLLRICMQISKNAPIGRWADRIVHEYVTPYAAVVQFLSSNRRRMSTARSMCLYLSASLPRFEQVLWKILYHT